MITAIVQDQPGYEPMKFGIDFATLEECKEWLDDRQSKVPTYATITNDHAHLATYYDGEWVEY